MWFWIQFEKITPTFVICMKLEKNQVKISIPQEEQLIWQID